MVGMCKVTLDHITMNGYCKGEDIMSVTCGGRRTHVFTSVTLQGRSSRVRIPWHFGRKMSLVHRDRKVLKPPLGN